MAMLRSCIFADEFDSNHEAWTATPPPDVAARLLALGAPRGNPRRLYWFQADDGRVSACRLDRYGSNFVIYSDVSTDARLLDRGGEIILTH
jgi:hypothetical protein